MWICIKGTRKLVKVFSLAKVFGKMGNLRCECELWRPYDLSCRVIGRWSPRFRLQLPNQPFLLVTLKQPKLCCTYNIAQKVGIHIYYNMRDMLRHSNVSQDLLYVGAWRWVKGHFIWRIWDICIVYCCSLFLLWVMYTIHTYLQTAQQD